jgi:hypothetical protein
LTFAFTLMPEFFVVVFMIRFLFCGVCFGWVSYAAWGRKRRAHYVALVDGAERKNAPLAKIFRLAPNVRRRGHDANMSGVRGAFEGGRSYKSSTTKFARVSSERVGVLRIPWIHPESWVSRASP